MIKRIPYDFIKNLLSKIDIVHIISKKINLKKQGKNFYSYCPFHKETKPSFTVSQSKQFYYCFGCQLHGNAIDFLMKYQGFGFLESVEELSFQAALTIPYKKKFIKDNESLNEEKLYKIMDKVNDFYRRSLYKEEYKQARFFLKKRGFNEEIISEFSIGFAPPGWNNLIKEFGKNIKERKLLNDIGMLINNKGKTYDLFRGSITFPIRNKNGKIIAFGGRNLNDRTQSKYINSPETFLFSKGKELYGLYELQKKTKS